MGCQIGRRTIVTEPMQCYDWNAVKFDDDCVVGGFLQFHTFENMILKVKQTHIKDGPEFWGEVQPPASLKGLDIPSRRAVFVPWKPSRRRAFGMGNPTFR
jgi:hypothetical protein